MNSFFCDYDEAMFPTAPVSPDEAIRLDEIVAHHEAGHAVAGYALGLGCRKIEIRAVYSLNPFNQYLSGMTSATVRPSARVLRGDYGPLIASIGIFAAAGAAAERKFFVENQVTAQREFELDEDHNSIDRIDKYLGFHHGRTPHAFKRLVWRRAQLLVAHPVCWAAIQGSAAELVAWYIPLDSVDASGNHCSLEVMPGQRSRAIIRRAGIRPGMFAMAAS